MVAYYNLLAGGRFELAMQLTVIGLVSLNSNSETHMTAIFDARLIYGRGRISPVFISCGPDPDPGPEPDPGGGKGALAPPTKNCSPK